MCLPPVGRPVDLPFTLIGFSVHNDHLIVTPGRYEKSPRKNNQA
jgi:hypothetical protein